MVSVISPERWKIWCERHQLPVAESLFSSSTCYFGFGMRSRPGTLLVTSTQMIHQSYSVRDTYWAMFEKPERVVADVSGIKSIQTVMLPLWLQIAHTTGKGATLIEFIDGSTWELVIHEGESEFFETVCRLTGLKNPSDKTIG